MYRYVRFGVSLPPGCLRSCKHLQTSWVFLSFSENHVRIGPNTKYFRNISNKPKLKEPSVKLSSIKSQLENKVSTRLNGLYVHYEEFVGLAEVQNAQDEVKKAETRFLTARAEERSIMREVLSVRDKLRHVRERLSHVDYSNPLYPQLANEQHELVTLEAKLQNDLEAVEDRERDTFMELSAAMRDSYEKERARVERTKNWSLIGTVVGAIVGMLSSVYINGVRTKDLKQAIVNRDRDEGLKESIENVIPYTQEQYTDIKDEIRNLQVCLINKLIEPPPDTQTFSTVANSMSDSTDNATLESLAKILQSFQAQLNVLLERNKEDRAELSLENENIRKEILSLKTAKQVDSKVAEEIFKISNTLRDVKSDLNRRESSSTESAFTATADAIQKPSKYKYVKDIALWSTVFSAIYYIINV